jgi:hypothetical protein
MALRRLRPLRLPPSGPPWRAARISRFVVLNRTPRSLSTARRESLYQPKRKATSCLQINEACRGPRGPTSIGSYMFHVSGVQVQIPVRGRRCAYGGAACSPTANAGRWPQRPHATSRAHVSPCNLVFTLARVSQISPAPGQRSPSSIVQAPFAPSKRRATHAPQYRRRRQASASDTAPLRRRKLNAGGRAVQTAGPCARRSPPHWACRHRRKARTGGRARRPARHPAARRLPRQDAARRQESLQEPR